ncbi:hypothetical protein ACI3KU_10250, partial [Microbacterium sp. ZW T5_56]
MAETKSENDRTSDSGENDKQHGLPAGADGELFGDHTALPAFGGPGDDADADPTEPVGRSDAAEAADAAGDDGETVIESDAGIIVVSDDVAPNDDHGADSQVHAIETSSEAETSSETETASETGDAAAAGDEAAASTSAADASSDAAPVSDAAPAGAEDTANEQL